MKNIYIYTFFIIITQCATNNNEVPHEIFNSVESYFDPIFKKEFKETPEGYVLDTYFSYFFYEFGELTKKHEEIKTYFQTINLIEDPSQAYVLLLLWHRKLNSKKFNLTKLLQMVNDDSEGVNSCRYVKKINSALNFRNLNLSGDIQMKFPVRIESNIKSTVYYGCPVLDWQFDPSKDLVINGKLIAKYYKPYYNDSAIEFYIQIKIKDMNRKDVLYFFNNINQNDTIEVNLNSYGIKL